MLAQSMISHLIKPTGQSPSLAHRIDRLGLPAPPKAQHGSVSLPAKQTVPTEAVVAGVATGNPIFISRSRENVIAKAIAAQTTFLLVAKQKF